jgi:uncharacterized protein YjbI with pentapeptide repeats
MARSHLRRRWLRFGSNDDRAPGIFPWIGTSVVTIALFGASAAIWQGWVTHQGAASLVYRGVLGAVAGALVGACVGMIGAIEVPVRVVTPTNNARDLWDPWLDAGTSGSGSDSGADSGSEEVEPTLPVRPVLVAERARVRPRIVSAEIGESLPLEDEIRPRIEAGECGAIRIMGAIGSGKTTALRHLASQMPPLAPVRFLDEPAPEAVAVAARQGLVVYVATNASYPKHLATYRLAPWGDDELLEYLMGGDRERCASVIARLRDKKADREFLQGVPELWRTVLDRMALDESVQNVRQALRIELNSRLANPVLRRAVQDDCLDALLVPSSVPPEEVLWREGLDEGLSRLIRHRPVQLLLAAEGMAASLACGEPCGFLGAPLARDLVYEAAARATENPGVMDRLRQLLNNDDRQLHPMAASLLHATRTGWRPDEMHFPLLAGAFLEGASWPGIVLRGAQMHRVDLNGADLACAVLDRAGLKNACLVGANLHDASLEHVCASGANLSHANLSSVRARLAHFEDARLVGAVVRGAQLGYARFGGADLSDARLTGSDLTQANLRQARIEGADFSRAILTGAVLKGLKLSGARFSGACFARATLDRCDLEGMELAGADFEGASLQGALLTGSSMRKADFRRANFREAGLAEIHWEHADLSHADLRGATFHMGSSRSGLVGSPIACEGSRTGFYTDDYDDQDFKRPEEIRKANLRGADLRGARIEGVDFYLVDLRGALFDTEQAAHFRRCGAILESRA